MMITNTNNATLRGKLLEQVGLDEWDYTNIQTFWETYEMLSKGNAEVQLPKPARVKNNGVRDRKKSNETTVCHMINLANQ